MFEASDDPIYSLALLVLFYMQLLSFATLIGAVFCFAAFCFHSLYVFLVLFAIGELLVFATQVPFSPAIFYFFYLLFIFFLEFELQY